MPDSVAPAAAAFDQFTRWTCTKCGRDGIDSWNKAVWDGPGFQTVEEVPNPWLLGDNCQRCGWACVVMYTTPDAAPRAIYSPVGAGDPFAYFYESEAFALIERNPSAYEELAPAGSRDADWSRGCLVAKGQLQ